AYDEGNPAFLEPQWAVGARCAVVYHLDGNGRVIADAVRDHDATQAVFENDPTVRVITEPITLEVDKPVVHRYLLYNGPVKPSLLKQYTGEKAVPADLVDRYADTLSLNTLTDYHSPGWWGSVSNTIYWTNLLIKCTNLMHWVLGKIHAVVP